MDTFETIKKFLDEGGKCLLIENGKPIGVVLTMEEYEFLKSKSQISNFKSQTEEKSLFSETNLPPQTPPYQGGDKGEVAAPNPIGEAIAKEMDFPEASANIDEINFADAGDVTLEDLGLDELPY